MANVSRNTNTTNSSVNAAKDADNTYPGLANTLDQITHFLDTQDKEYLLKKQFLFTSYTFINSILMQLTDIFTGKEQVSADFDEITAFFGSNLSLDIANGELFPIFYCQIRSFTYQMALLLTMTDDNTISPGVILARTNLKGETELFSTIDEDGSYVWKSLDEDAQQDFSDNYSMFSKASDDFHHAIAASVSDEDAENILGNESAEHDSEEASTLESMAEFYDNHYENLIKLHSVTFAKTKFKVLNSKESFGLPEFALTSKISPNINIGVIEKPDGFYACLINDLDFKKSVFDPKTAIYTEDSFLADSIYCFSEKMSLKEAMVYINRVFPLNMEEDHMSMLMLPKSKWKDGVLQLKFDSRLAIREFLYNNAEIQAKGNDDCIYTLKKWIDEKPEKKKGTPSITDISI